VSVLVAVGSQGRLTPLDHAEEIAEAIPGAVLRVIPDAGHLPPLEMPEAVSELLRAWLDSSL
jgi:pimeloyl-ACP methyl ester carboxylesterase